MITSEFAIKYVQEQLGAYKKIQASLPPIHMGDHFLGYDIVKSVGDHIRSLYLVLSEIQNVKTYEEVKKTLEDLIAFLTEEKSEEYPADIIVSIYSNVVELFACEARLL